MKNILLFLLAFACTFKLYAQTKTITGKVTVAENNKPLEGVTVNVKGTTTISLTDEKGTYTIEVPSSGSTLIFSYIGFKTESVEVGELLMINVALIISEAIIDEVVIVGYGTQIKTELTGSISTIRSDEIEFLPVSTLEQTLQGRAAGFFIEANNGKIGSAFRMRIRGTSSISANNEPLVILDGVPINLSPVNDQSYIRLNPLNDIEFNDIASVEILKDASAAAIYGSRGANGVIIITTKRGKSGDPKISIDFQQGFSKPTRLREFMDAQQFISYFEEAAINRGVYAFANGQGNFDTEQEAIDKYLEDVHEEFDEMSGWSDWRQLETNTDWQSLAFQPASSRNADVSVSGGTDKLTYFISSGYSQQDGIMLNNEGDRINGLINLDSKLSGKVNFGLNLNLIRGSNNDIPDDNSFSTPLQLVALSPLTPPKDTTGEYYDQPVTTYYNGLIQTDNVISTNITFRTIGNLTGDYKILPYLTIRGEAGGDITNFTQNFYANSKTQSGQATNGYGENFSNKVENYDVKALLLFNRVFKEMHDLEITGGTEYQSFTQYITRIDGTGFPNDKLQTLSSAAEIVFWQGSATYYRFLSYFLRANYHYKSKYLVTVSGRADGSSRFGTNVRYGFFPAVSGGWIITSEPFLLDSKWLSFLKVRASYGLTGNAGIGNFKYQGLYGVASYHGASGLYPLQIENPDLSWEETAQLDIGIDFGFANNRINGEMDYYIEKTSDLLLDVPIASTTGYTILTQNIGKLENRGFEFMLNYDILVNDFKWSANVNFAANKNEVTELANGQTIITGAGFLNVIKVGESIGTFYGAEYAGVDPDNGDALFYLNEDEASDETTSDFNQANFVVLGDPNPDFIAGMTHSFSYKRISLDVTLQSVYGNDIQVSGDHWMGSNGGQWDNQLVSQLDSWENPGDNTLVPEAILLIDNGTSDLSSRYLSDGSYLRVKTVTLAYLLPKSVLKKLKLDYLRIYSSAYNLFTFTNYVGWDPEVSSDSFVSPNEAQYFGFDFYSAPQPRTIVFGVNIGL